MTIVQVTEGTAMSTKGQNYVQWKEGNADLNSRSTLCLIERRSC